MKIRIKSGIDGGKEAKGIVVIIDVFRATSTITTLLAKNVEFILPVLTIEEAFNRKDAGYILVGERGGIKVEGFDYDNSPYRLSKLDLLNKKIVLTTTNGTKGILNATDSPEILIGSFLNIEAVVRYIKSIKTRSVTLVPIGRSDGKAVEDELCAKFIKSTIEDKITDFSKIKEKIINSESAEKLKKNGNEEDLYFCLEPNKYKIVPKVFKGHENKPQIRLQGYNT